MKVSGVVFVSADLLALSCVPGKLRLLRDTLVHHMGTRCSNSETSDSTFLWTIYLVCRSFSRQMQSLFLVLVAIPFSAQLAFYAPRFLPVLSPCSPQVFFLLLSFSPTSVGLFIAPCVYSVCQNGPGQSHFGLGQLQQKRKIQTARNQCKLKAQHFQIQTQ